MVNQTDLLNERVLEQFGLTGEQRAAALERSRDVVVTAGAGSGKTLTLVARYITLLAEGIQPRRIAAVTFSKKAAREMRSRVRINLTRLEQAASSEGDRRFWAGLSSQMDAARIGTIHSLCSEILRAHPAEAGIDPRFEVLDEGNIAVLRRQAVSDTLSALIEKEKFLPLLKTIKIRHLNEILLKLLDRHLTVEEVLEKEVDNRGIIANELRNRMKSPQVAEPIEELRGMNDVELVRDAGEKLANMVSELLRLWGEAEQYLAYGDPIACAACLFIVRRKNMNRRLGGKESIVKGLVAELQASYDLFLNPLVGGKDSKDSPPSDQSEADFEALLPLLIEAFHQVQCAYQTLVESRHALDFDDLESGAQLLLRQTAIRERWQAELDAVLVDEFQDTNQRQREIVEALVGKPGGLFIVGDSRQSIYRFRNADVTVFREVQERIKQQSGLLIDLNRTYRAHEPLLLATGELLSRVIGTEEDETRKYFVPYTPLIANAKESPEHIFSPHIEFVLGACEDAQSARPLAAVALAERLHQLKNEGQIKRWDDVTLLFRASTGFPFYEEAFEDAGIPFVTVAGRGFYDRPEIRDLVNILRGLADPFDDLSFAGLLRSPAFGLSDTALYLLHQDDQSYWIALLGDLSMLSESDQRNATRCRQIISVLLPLVDRIPVADLLKQIVDVVDYRAILATADLKTGDNDSSEAGGRLWRNLDKLLEDAQASQQVCVRDYLDQLQTMNDAGAREGEAPSETDGAVRLMTIHKAKGLEFNVVVLADASRQPRSGSSLFYLSNDLGFSIKLDPAPMLYRLAKERDMDQDRCEEFRLLYVALTRTKNKLLISGHATRNTEGKVSMRGWMKELTNAAEILPGDFGKANGIPFDIETMGMQRLRAWCLLGLPEKVAKNHLAEQIKPLLESHLPPLYQSLEAASVVEKEEEFDTLNEYLAWKVTSIESGVPGNVLGNMVHKALECWQFPGDSGLDTLLETEALTQGLGSEIIRSEAVHRAFELLKRFHAHPLWEEIDSALERHHELPYLYQLKGWTENRFIDLLYRDGKGWHVVDFKTDPIVSPSQKSALLREYTPQVQRYVAAVKQLLGVEARGSICFLDDHGKVGLAGSL